MFAAPLVVLAVAALTPPAPPGPLSPADLPPPPGAKSVEPYTPSSPAVPPLIAEARHCELAFRTVPVSYPAAEVPARAVAAVAGLDRARFAEVDGDRSTRGYTDSCRVVVEVVAEPAGTTAYVFTASYLNGVAERAAEAVAGGLKGPAAPPDPSTRFGARDADREARVPPVRCVVEARPVNKYGRHFPAQAGLALERRGYEPAASSGNVACTAVGGRRLDRHAALIMTTDGPKGGSTHFIAVVVGPDPKVVADDAEAVCELVVRGFYD